MSFLYPRTVTITRPCAQTGVGAQAGYDAELAGTEGEIATGLPASIQARSSTSKGPVGLPGDGNKQIWRVLMPKSALADGVVKNFDIVTDDLGNRFQVVADYVNSLGANLICERLEA